jgi:hypothetical protein
MYGPPSASATQKLAEGHETDENIVVAPPAGVGLTPPAGFTPGTGWGADHEVPSQKIASPLRPTDRQNFGEKHKIGLNMNASWGRIR